MTNRCMRAACTKDTRMHEHDNRVTHACCACSLLLICLMRRVCLYANAMETASRAVGRQPTSADAYARPACRCMHASCTRTSDTLPAPLQRHAPTTHTNCSCNIWRPYLDRTHVVHARVWCCTPPRRCAHRGIRGPCCTHTPRTHIDTCGVRDARSEVETCHE